jgi:DinB superfamily
MTRKSMLTAVLFLAIAALPALAQGGLRPTAEIVRGHFMSINKKILDMAKDFPEDKYDFRLKPEMRSFREVIVHIAGGNIYAARAGRGEKINWDDSLEPDPKNYKTKADVVAMFEKSVNDANAALKALPDSAFVKTVDPWVDVTEHSAEHYGLLVAYYRANGLVPPASRPKK